MEAADIFKTLDLELKPDPARTVIRPFGFSYPAAFAEGRPTRSQAVATRLMALTPEMRSRGGSGSNQTSNTNRTTSPNFVS